MPNKIHGVSTAYQNLTSSLYYYKVYIKSPGAFTDPINATEGNIHVTGNINDISQKNFEVLLQMIGLRAMPVVMNEPVGFPDLGIEGSTKLSGKEGFIWKFAVELAGVFNNTGPRGTISNVGFLIDEIHGLVLPNGTRLISKSGTGFEINIDFDIEEVFK